MNCDKVAVRIDRIGQPDWTKHKRGKNHRAAGMSKPDDEAAGYVEKIIERGMARIVGTYFRSGKFAHVQPDDQKIPDVNIERDSVSHSFGSAPHSSPCLPLAAGPASPLSDNSKKPTQSILNSAQSVSPGRFVEPMGNQSGSHLA